MKKILCVAALSFLGLGAAHAQQAQPSPLYGELGYTALKGSGGGVSVRPAMLRAIIGYDFHPNFAAEGMLGVGVKDGSFDAYGVNGKVKIQHSLGVFIKPKFNATNDLELFARLGYTDAKVKTTVMGASYTEKEGSAAYGVGLNYKFSPSAYVGVDYMNYYRKNGSKTDGVTVGVGFRF